MNIELSREEIEFMKRSIDNHNPFASSKEAKQRVYTTMQRIDDLKKQLENDESHLEHIENRDAMVLKLKDKFGV